LIVTDLVFNLSLMLKSSHCERKLTHWLGSPGTQ